jgi:hypothetical protein
MGQSWARLFDANIAQEIAWTLGPALLCLLIVVARRGQLKPHQRAVALAVGGALALAFPILSFMPGMHTYYAYSLAAPSAVLIAAGLSVVFRGVPESWIDRATLAVLIAGSSYLGLRVLGYADGWGWWPWIVGGLGYLTAALLLLPPGAVRLDARHWKTVASVVVCASLCLGPAATDMATASTRQVAGFPLSGHEPRDPNAIAKLAATIRQGDPDQLPVLVNGAPISTWVDANVDVPSGGWLIATYPAQNAAVYQLETGRPALALGGWSGIDHSFNVNEVQGWMEGGRIAYFVTYDALDSYFAGTDIAKIEDWVRDRYLHHTSDGITVYDLRQHVQR